MKKRYYFYAILAGCIAMTTASCGDDNDYEPKVSTVKVVEADTELAAAGESKTFAVTGSGITVSLPQNATWITASVSGNNITVTAEPNLGRETRHALLTITAANGDQSSVNFSQYGAIFTIDAPSVLHVADDAKSTEIYCKYNLPITVKAGESWLNVQMADSKMVLTPTANTTGNMRQTYVYYEIGTVNDSILVRQYDFDNDILGKYLLYFYNSRATGWETFAINLAKGEEAGTGLITFDDEDFEGFSIPVTFDEESLTLSIENLAPAGKYTDVAEDGTKTEYNVLVFVRGLSGNSIYRHRSTAYAAVGYYTAWDDGTFGWEFDANNTMASAGYQLYGISFGASSDGTYDGYAGWLQHFYNIVLEKAAE